MDKWRPTRREELLLHAALGEGSVALNAWEAWTRESDLHTLDRGSQRLLPLVGHNLRKQGERVPAFLEQASMETWRQNQMLFHATAGVIALFRDAGIGTIALKGAALAVLFYRDPALRPMSDIDLLVPSDRAADAMSLLRASGWRAAVDEPERLIPFRHSIGFHDDRGGSCDLHWRAMWDGLLVDDAEFRAAAVRLEIGGEATAALCASDQLLHVCVHGISWHEARIRWIADATVILREARDEIDWERLVDQAARRHLVAPARATLRYLRAFLGDLVPASVIERLDRLPVTRTNRLIYSLRTGRGGPLKRVPSLVYWGRALKATPGPLHRKATEGLRYLRSHLLQLLPRRNHGAKD